MIGKFLRRILPLPGAQMKLQPGDPAPTWECVAHDGSTVSSSQLAGSRYVLWFYPKADTPG